jgi:hypothetical protein
MNKLFTIALIMIAFYSNLLAKLPYEQKVMIYNNFIKTQPENAVFKVVKAIDDGYDNLAKFKGITKAVTKNTVNNKFNYENAIQIMCLSIGTIENINCPRETFVTAILKDDNSKNLTKASSNEIGVQGVIARQLPLGFEKSDPYNNKDKYYLFDAVLSQRINKDTALFSKGNMYFLLKIPEGSYSENFRYVGIVKGLGSYKYTTVTGSRQIIPEGNVLTIHNQ